MPMLGVAGDTLPRNPKRRDRPNEGTGQKRRKRNKKRRKSSQVQPATRPSSRVVKKPKVVRQALVVKPRLLYALELEDGRYYIGQSSAKDASFRFKQHASGGKLAAKWTKLHPPVRIVETVPLGECSVSYAAIKEDELTLRYITQYGIRYVRGGGMCQIDEAQAIRALKKKLKRLERSKRYVLRRAEVEDDYQQRLGVWYKDNF